jgi:hypothetical protein
MDKAKALPERLEPFTLDVFWEDNLPWGQHATGAVPDVRRFGCARVRAGKAHAASAPPVRPRHQEDVTLVLGHWGSRSLLDQYVSGHCADAAPGAGGCWWGAGGAHGGDDVAVTKEGLVAARNAGLEASRLPLVAFTRSDATLHARWLERAAAALEPGISAIIGAIFPQRLEDAVLADFHRYWGRRDDLLRRDFTPELLQLLGRRGFQSWEFGEGAAALYRREAFERLGLFDERLDRVGGGRFADFEFAHRIMRAGGSVRFEPTAAAFQGRPAEAEGGRIPFSRYAAGHAMALLTMDEAAKGRGRHGAASSWGGTAAGRQRFSVGAGAWRSPDFGM